MSYYTATILESVELESIYQLSCFKKFNFPLDWKITDKKIGCENSGDMFALINPGIFF